MSIINDDNGFLFNVDEDQIIIDIVTKIYLIQVLIIQCKIETKNTANNSRWSFALKEI